MTAEKIFKSLQNLVNEVDRMREFQKEYFRYRDPKVLNASKIQEKKVDEMITLFKNFKFKSNVKAPDPTRTTPHDDTGREPGTSSHRR